MGSLLDRAKARLAKMKASVIAGPQKVGSKLVVRRNVTYDPESDELRNMRSSWVDWFEYDDQTHVFTMKVKGNNTLYTWEGVDKQTALLAQRGATCKTDDATGKRRWWPDKTASLGAAYWYILKPFTRQSSAANLSTVDMGQTTYDIYAGGFNLTTRYYQKPKIESTGYAYFERKRGRRTDLDKRKELEAKLSRTRPRVSP